MHEDSVLFSHLVIQELPTQTSFIIMSNEGRLPASGLGAKRAEAAPWSSTRSEVYFASPADSVTAEMGVVLKPVKNN